MAPCALPGLSEPAAIAVLVGCDVQKGLVCTKLDDLCRCLSHLLPAAPLQKLYCEVDAVPSLWDAKHCKRASLCCGP